MDLDLPLHPLFGELVRDQPRGEAIGIERHAKLGGEIGDGTDMILVPMGQHDAEQILAPILDELEVGHHDVDARIRSEEHTSELQSLMRISYAVFCLKKKK